ncbi:MAG: cytochrome P450, partial [Vicinamibacterales bacterium]
QLLHEHEEALGPSIQRFSHAIPGGFLRYMNVETHSLYGPLFRQALSLQTIAHGWPVAVATTRRELDVAASLAKGTRTGPVEPNEYLERIVTHTFQRILFGITPGTPASEQLTRVYAPLASMALSDQPTREARTALDELRRMLRAQSDEWRRRSGGGDPPVCALGELGRLDARMPDVTCVDNLVFIYKISSANVAGLLRWLLAILGRHPEWIGRLRSELQAPEPSGPPALVDRIIMETLRLSQAEYLYRRLRLDLPFEGFVLPKGWLVRICVWESHRNVEAFDEPERFNPDRFLGRDFSRASYLPFGGDRHSCNGVALTNLICRAFLEEMTRAYDWAVEGPVELERDFRHWSHWRPGRRLRLKLQPIIPSTTASSATSLDGEAAAVDRSHH